MAGLDNLQQGGDGIIYPPESCTNLDITPGFGFDFMTHTHMVTQYTKPRVNTSAMIKKSSSE